MQKSATATLNKPWYKQFWPWFLIVLPGSVVIASLFTVYLAFHYADTVINETYYKDDVEINKSK
jgi:hypothetical protein